MTDIQTTPTEPTPARTPARTVPSAVGSAASEASRFLDGKRAAYLVDSGAADLFAVRQTDDGSAALRNPVARLPAGSVLHTCAATGTWRLLLVPLPGTRLREISHERLRRLRQMVRDADQPSGADSPGATVRSAALGFTVGVDRGLLAIATALGRGSPPRGTTIIQPGSQPTLAAGDALAANGSVTWLTPLDGQLLPDDDTPAADTPAADTAGTDTAGTDTAPVALVGRDWVVARTACTLRSETTLDLLRSGQLWEVLENHGARVLAAAERRIREAEAEHLRRLDDRHRVNAAVVRNAARQSLRVLGIGAHRVRLGDAPVTEVDRLARGAAVLRVVTGDPELVREPVDRGQEPRDEREALLAVARSSALYTRELALPAGWWRRDFGPLVIWRPIGEQPELDPVDERPVLALPAVFRRGRYHTVDPDTLARTPVGRAEAAGFAEHALTVQLPMPPGGGLRGLLGAGVRGARRDAAGVLLTGLLVAALGLATPLVTGDVLGRLAAGGGSDRLLEVSALFVVTALVAAMVGVINNLMFLRLEGRLERDTQIAAWDRLMRLPLRFFGSTSSGELTSMVMGITFVREALGGLLAQALSAGLVIVMVVVLLFAVDAAVAGLALAVVAAVALMTVVLGAVVVRRQRRALPAEHRIAALTNQIIDGITKVKLAAAEDRAYAQWAGVNTTAEWGMRRVRGVQAMLLAMTAAIPTAGQLLLLAVLAGPLAGRIGTAQFFVVNAAFLMLMGMLMVLVNAGVEALALLPRIEDLALVADTEVERRADRVDPGELRGGIELADVSFAYSDDGPMVLDRLSLQIQPGQFVAIVGPSGCGKSTLLRLLLGFDQPLAGSVLYDRQDLSELDVTAVRRQCGVVLQNGQLFAGSIRENIAGAADYPLDRLWDAARMAGIDTDIADLPMGMATVLPFGGGTLSVGQRQRLLIARALVGRPRILFFDEATSALDNRTQEIVTTSTRALAATRVVIAHRLSTIADADLIIVLDRGRVVQQGRYADLIADSGGMFAELARRQLLDDADTDADTDVAAGGQPQP
ncbi:ATP-binding cassette domain-containing protein [Frankia sp. CcI49]|uniref:ATP-binding cassette domain-containing protein n=1 Tax=Frankia sp. CcI49 TaxID=1745382 RepID=UPI0018E9E04E|nr:ATP-binding cassette domain-containing protein [Frankia sp. CcI49]